MSVLLEPLRALLNMVTSLINGLIVGALHFILNLLDGQRCSCRNLCENRFDVLCLYHEKLPFVNGAPACIRTCVRTQDRHIG